MNIFHVNNRRGALCLSGRRMGYPACVWSYLPVPLRYPSRLSVWEVLNVLTENRVMSDMYYRYSDTVQETWLYEGMIWVRSRNSGCLVTWFCYQSIAKPGNKATTVSWPDPYIVNNDVSLRYFLVLYKTLIPRDVLPCYIWYALQFSRIDRPVSWLWDVILLRYFLNFI